MNYWADKNKLALQAKIHAETMETRFAQNIDECVKKTIIFDEKWTHAPTDKHQTRIVVEDTTSVDAIQRYTPLNTPSHKTCVLNFASHKHPGGMFLEGSSAQEESLCHASILYNVLSRLPSYYQVNKQFLNRSLYSNRAVYSPNVLFPNEEGVRYVDVLTCAAPNKTSAQKYCRVSDAENSKYLKERINFVLSIAASQHPDVFILGAYGCGVFGQNPIEVAAVFKELLNTSYQGAFPLVVFAIPDKAGNNYRAFDKAFQDTRFAELKCHHLGE